MINSSSLLTRVCVLWIIFISSFVVMTRSDQNDPLVNYITTADLGDGEREVRMRFGDIIVRETSVSSSTKTDENGVRISLLLRQVSSGEDFLQMIFQIKEVDGFKIKQKLLECEIVNDLGAADQFRSQFESELKNLVLP